MPKQSSSLPSEVLTEEERKQFIGVLYNAMNMLFDIPLASLIINVDHGENSYVILAIFDEAEKELENQKEPSNQNENFKLLPVMAFEFILDLSHVNAEICKNNLTELCLGIIKELHSSLSNEDPLHSTTVPSTHIH